MRRGRAAQYCDLTSADFEREIAAGRLPTPVMLGGEEHWCRITLDEHLDRLAGRGDGDDWRKGVKLYATKG